MFAPPPKLNSLVIKTNSFEEMETFYLNMGIAFNRRFQNNRLRKISYINDSFNFEIVEVNTENEKTTNIEFELLIINLKGYLEIINNLGVEIVRQIWGDEKGSHLIFKDPNDNFVTLSELK